MNKTLVITLFGGSLLLFVLFYVLSKVYYYKKHQIKYRFQQMFPYEFNYPNVFKDNVFGNLLFLFALGFIVGFYFVFYNAEFFPKTATGLTTIIASIVLSMLFLCLLLMPLNYLRTHAIISIFSTTISVAIPVINLLLAYQVLQLYKSTSQPIYLPIISMVVSGIMAILMIVLIFNPKATYKIYMDKTLDTEGNEVFIRPKIIYLALTEWWSIFTFFISPLALILLIIN